MSANRDLGHSSGGWEITTDSLLLSVHPENQDLGHSLVPFGLFLRQALFLFKRPRTETHLCRLPRLVPMFFQYHQHLRALPKCHQSKWKANRALHVDCSALPQCVYLSLTVSCNSRFKLYDGSLCPPPPWIRTMLSCSF